MEGKRNMKMLVGNNGNNSSSVLNTMGLVSIIRIERKRRGNRTSNSITEYQLWLTHSLRSHVAQS